MRGPAERNRKVMPTLDIDLTNLGTQSGRLTFTDGHSKFDFCATKIFPTSDAGLSVRFADNGPFFR